MNNKKMNKVDFIFIMGVIVIAIIGVAIDGMYWDNIQYGGFPVFSCISIFASYALWIILLIYSSLKSDENRPQYVRGYMFFVLPFFHMAVIIMLLIILAIFINIFEALNK